MIIKIQLQKKNDEEILNEKERKIIIIIICRFDVTNNLL